MSDMRWQAQILGNGGGQYRRFLSPATYQSAGDTCVVPTTPGMIYVDTDIPEIPTMYAGVGFIPAADGTMLGGTQYMDGPSLDAISQIPYTDGGGILVVACCTPGAVHHTQAEWDEIVEINADTLSTLRDGLFYNLTRGLGGMSHELGGRSIGGSRLQVRRPTWMTQVSTTTQPDDNGEDMHSWTEDFRGLLGAYSDASKQRLTPSAAYTLYHRTPYGGSRWDGRFRAPIVNAGPVKISTGLSLTGVYCDALGYGENLLLWGFTFYDYKYIGGSVPWLYYGTIDGKIYYGDWEFQGFTNNNETLTDFLTWWVMAPVPAGFETHLNLVEG